MNVSMQDTYNLGWKLGSVISGHSSRSILKTYETERRKVAQELIDFDHRFSRLFSGRPAKDVMDEEGISIADFKETLEKGNLFASGIAVDYDDALLVAKEGSSKQGLASNIPLGMRMPSFKVLNQSDARPWHLQELLPSTGRWRLLIFAGNILCPPQNQNIHVLGVKLLSATSFLRLYTPSTSPTISSVIECLLVHSAPRKEVDVFDFPLIFRPFSPTDGWDYSKIFVDDESYHEGHGKAYKNHGIDPEQGCAVIIRTDQYVSWVGEADDYEGMERFFGVFMRVQKSPWMGRIDLPEGWAVHGEAETSDGIEALNGKGITFYSR